MPVGEREQQIGVISALADKNLSVLVRTRHRSSPRPQPALTTTAGEHLALRTVSRASDSVCIRAVGAISTMAARRSVAYLQRSSLFIAVARAQSHEWTPTALSCVGRTYNMAKSCRECGVVEGTMDDVIGRLVATVGIDRAAAEKAVGIILDLLAKEGPPDKVQSYLAKLLGADAPRQKAASAGAGGVGGVTGAVMRMMGASPSMGKVQSVS